VDGVDLDARERRERGRDVVLGRERVAPEQQTSAPSATRVLIKTPVSFVTCRFTPIRKPESGASVAPRSFTSAAMLRSASAICASPAATDPPPLSVCAPPLALDVRARFFVGDIACGEGAR